MVVLPVEDRLPEDRPLEDPLEDHPSEEYPEVHTEDDYLMVLLLLEA